MPKNPNLELRDINTPSATSTKKLTRCRSFHFRYLELCRTKNLTPLSDIKTKNNCTSALDFYGDKLTVTDWLLIVEALYNDQVLQTLAIRMRKTFAMGKSVVAFAKWKISFCFRSFGTFGYGEKGQTISPETSALYQIHLFGNCGSYFQLH